MDIDFEKIRCESLEAFNSKLDSENNITMLIEQISYITSMLCKDMLIKYHEELNKTKE